MPRIYGKGIMLREYRKDDLPSIRRWVNDPGIVDSLSDLFLYPHTAESTEQYLEAAMEERPDGRSFVIAELDSESYIGQAGLDEIDWKNRCAAIGIVIGSADRMGQGFGTEAVRLLIRLAFEELNLNRLELEVYDFNERARRCYSRCGFNEEGRKREKLYRRGRYCDVIGMGLLKADWLAQR